MKQIPELPNKCPYFPTIPIMLIVTCIVYVRVCLCHNRQNCNLQVLTRFSPEQRDCYQVKRKRKPKDILRNWNVKNIIHILKAVIQNIFTSRIISNFYQEHEIDLKYLPKSHGWDSKLEKWTFSTYLWNLETSLHFGH